MPRELTGALDRALAPAPEARGTLDELRVALAGALEGARRPARLLRPPAGNGAARVVTERRERTEPPREVAPREVARERAEREGAEVEPSREEPRALQRSSGVRLPRAIWLGGAAALAVWQAATGRPGVALIVLAGAAPLLALPRRAGVAWMSCALAPLLGLAGVASAFPAIAGQAGRWSERAALGALGYWWLVLAEPLLARRLWLGHPSGVSARAVWEGSLSSTAVGVVGPLLTLGVLLGAALWGAGAAVLPWIVRGRRAALDVVAAAMWAAALAAAASSLDDGLSRHAAPRGLVLGAVLGAALAVAARALRGPV